MITGRNTGGTPLISVGISGIDQEPPIVDELTVVNAVRTYLASLPGVQVVVAQKYEQTITVV
jgi:hypothetical protein